MYLTNITMPETIILDDKEFHKLSNFIITKYGIKLPPTKKVLLQCRLQKRIKELQLASFKEYVDLLFASKSANDEITRMIDAVCTNKTDFFREPAHFEFLQESGIRDYLKRSRKNKLTIWSAGCSSGEEPYTLAMVLNELNDSGLDFDYRILATDISETILHKAVSGIYSEDRVETIPMALKKKYLLKGKNDYINKVKIAPFLQSKVEFRKFNLLDPEFAVLGKFDLIFCRNVMIYFDQVVQHRLLQQFSAVLNPYGYLFLGHSESITGHALPLHYVRPTVFQKDSNTKSNRY